ncbi:CPBP family intramembrane glutamic endopeptidase [Fundicoccus culcitae]|uniref:CPBP family intramembrane metalloprotease n=1 Tax=Fundicoccus culcitae TaxID=2969821 RepID=A0ABY5P6N5_9LACT|nr:CPBP family intramembrane glutamic endopeptidase [Fundicoccus culcitae]UUX34402.1 CPBP family intramembrane metalloprotease [Fundicoccus culcitae]
MNLSMRSRAAVMIISYFVVQLLLAPILTRFMSVDMSSIVASAILLMIALLIYGKHLVNEFHRFKHDFDGWGKFILKAVGYYLLLYILRVIVMMVLMNFMDIDNLLQNQQSLNDMSTSLSFLSMFFMVSIYAPIVEELVFREALLGWVDKISRNLLILMTVFSIFLFTLLHAFEIADFLLYLPLTLVLTKYYFDYDRNVVGSIAFHFINNAIAVVLMYILL